VVMDIHLPEDLEQFVNEQVRAGRFRSKDHLVKEALERLRDQGSVNTDMGSIGAMREDAKLLDEIVEDAMRARETRPWRLPAGE
jgi:putative addiction module CopG family antidote